MPHPRRRPRFILIPHRRGLTPGARAPQDALRALGLQAAARQRAGAPVEGALLPGLRVIDRSRPDGAVLVASALSREGLQAQVEAARVVEEHWYTMQRTGLRPVDFKPAVRRAGTATRVWTVRVRLDDGRRTPLKDVLVTVLPDEGQDTGAEGRTDRQGRVQLVLSGRTRRVDWLLVDPLHTGWPVALADVAVGDAELEVVVPAIDLAAPDARGRIYGKPPARAGRGVKVAVLDSGVGPHRALHLAGGRNTTPGETPGRRTDWHGHGSHVAGLIAATAAGWRRGEAAAVELFGYRIFEQGADEASSFAISTAIKEAAVAGCDLVNLSIGGGPFDAAISDAIDKAWELGCVCVCAAGNDGHSQVDYPARYRKAVAVSAIGLEGSWPAGASQVHQVSQHVGRRVADLPVFFAAFSNRGAKVALTAPGVGIVSTISGQRWGVMDGTSMAAPIATGVIARRLAASPVLAMPRTPARAQAIVELALAHAQDLGLPAHAQGAGLAR